jgi:hypothetical protein
MDRTVYTSISWNIIYRIKIWLFYTTKNPERNRLLAKLKNKGVDNIGMGVDQIRWVGKHCIRVIPDYEK